MSGAVFHCCIRCSVALSVYPARSREDVPLTVIRSTAISISTTFLQSSQ